MFTTPQELKSASEQKTILLVMPRCYPELNTSDRLRLRRLPINHLPPCPELYPAQEDCRMDSDVIPETERAASVKC
jgi:hypothetical protein